MNSHIGDIDNRAVVSQLFKAAFGTAPIYLPFPLGKTKQPDMEGYEVKVDDNIYNKFEQRKSIYNTPVVAPVFFQGRDYKVYDKKGKIITKKFEDFWLPATTMVDFSRAKNIIKTNVLGGNGTVKEIYGFDDWVIRIRILCFNEEMSARAYEAKLVEFSEIIEPIDVKCVLFTEKEIHSLVIEDIDIRSVVGQPDVVPVELNCISDEAIELFNEMK